MSDALNLDLEVLSIEMERAKGESIALSFNSAQGQCERCRGAGFEKIEMQFLSDVFIRCPDCAGRRYRAHILEVKLTAAHKVADRRPAEIMRDPVRQAGLRPCRHPATAERADWRHRA